MRLRSSTGPSVNATDATDMKDPDQNAVRNALEAMVDREGIADVLGMLAEVCVGTAERGGEDAQSWMELAATLDLATSYAMDELVEF